MVYIRVFEFFRFVALPATASYNLSKIFVVSLLSREQEFSLAPISYSIFDFLSKFLIQTIKSIWLQRYVARASLSVPYRGDGRFCFNNCPLWWIFCFRLQTRFQDQRFWRHDPWPWWPHG